MNRYETCQDDARRTAVRKRPEMNGLDYLEVSDDQLTLTVYFLGKAPSPLLRGPQEPASDYQRRLRRAVVIEGGRRVSDIQVVDVDIQQAKHPRTGKVLPDMDDTMTVKVDRPGDFSIYTLRLAGVENIDRFYDHIDFSFKVNCPSELDCAADDACPVPVRDQPDINYLARDYAGFRQSILDRLALIMPDWRERHVPDLGIALVELLAYTGDYLSYYQDAVATEAYLDTARRRISVRRHARLVDYRMHEGCNARAWVTISTDSDFVDELALDPQNIFFTTGLSLKSVSIPVVLSQEELDEEVSGSYEVFEPLHAGRISLYQAHNRILFYTWGNQECCLSRGAVTATLQDGRQAGDRLYLNPGDVLIFEEVKGPHTGLEADADPAHRHAVRLTGVTRGVDALDGAPVVEIEWGAEDALPFPLCISAMSGPENNCAYIEHISVARGNVLLVDHGRTRPADDLGQVPCERMEVECLCEDRAGETRWIPGRFRAKLDRRPLTHRSPFPLTSTVARQQERLLGQVVGQVLAWVARLLKETRAGRKLENSEREELQTLFGEEALYTAGQQAAAGRQKGSQDDGWQDSAGQAEAIEYLLANAGRLLAAKSQRTAVLQRRAQAGLARNPVAGEIAALFGDRFAAGLALDSAAMLGPASAALHQDPRQALPVIQLRSLLMEDGEECREARKTEQGQWQSWEPRYDLLASGPDHRHYVAEVDDDGFANLRFGNGELGRQPEAGSAFRAAYRVGNGSAGNVGAEAISHLVLRNTSLSGVSIAVRNPLPATGGVEPEPVMDVKMYAPTAFREPQQRAVTAADYAQLAQAAMAQKVQGTAGNLSWTGSWYEAHVSIDPLGAAQAAAGLLSEIERGLEPYRRVGHDLAVTPARYVPLDLEMTVCVKPHYLRGQVEAELRSVFSSRTLPNGQRGFFHPDRLAFGGAIYLSQVIAAAQAVTGVESVIVNKLQRWEEGDNQELRTGVLQLGKQEIARLDSDPSFPENGRLVFHMEGGR